MVDVCTRVVMVLCWWVVSTIGISTYTKQKLKLMDIPSHCIIAM